MTPFPHNEVVNYAAPSNYVYGGASGLDLPPALPGAICSRCWGQFTRPTESEPITGYRSNGGTICKACKDREVPA